MSNTLTVSVVMITYNHEKFIEEAIGGVLMQNCDYDIELVIANDKSSDLTDQVINKYLSQVNIPKNIKIEYTNHKENKGMMPNFIWALQETQGKYISLCEGDDYWTDPLKLQKQVGFLEEHEEFTGIGSNSEVLIQETKEIRKFKNTENDEILEIDKFLKGRFFHTASFMFKNDIVFPNEFSSVLSGDRLLFLLVASKGKIFYKNEITCTYRKNIGGISKRVTSSQMIKDINFLNICKGHLSKKQLNILEKFILKTIFDYSHVIKFNHFIYVSSRLLFISGINYKVRKQLKKGFKKVNF